MTRFCLINTHLQIPARQKFRPSGRPSDKKIRPRFSTERLRFPVGRNEAGGIEVASINNAGEWEDDSRKYTRLNSSFGFFCHPILSARWELGKVKFNKTTDHFSPNFVDYIGPQNCLIKAAEMESILERQENIKHFLRPDDKIKYSGKFTKFWLEIIGQTSKYFIFKFWCPFSYVEAYSPKWRRDKGVLHGVYKNGKIKNSDISPTFFLFSSINL